MAKKQREKQEEPKKRHHRHLSVKKLKRLLHLDSAQTPPMPVEVEVEAEAEAEIEIGAQTAHDSPVVATVVEDPTSDDAVTLTVKADETKSKKKRPIVPRLDLSKLDNRALEVKASADDSIPTPPSGPAPLPPVHHSVLKAFCDLMQTVITNKITKDVNSVGDDVLAFNHYMYSLLSGFDAKAAAANDTKAVPLESSTVKLTKSLDDPHISASHLSPKTSP